MPMPRANTRMKTMLRQRSRSTIQTRAQTQRSRPTVRADAQQWRAAEVGERREAASSQWQALQWHVNRVVMLPAAR